MNMRIITAIAALLCTLPLAAQVNTTSTEAPQTPPTATTQAAATPATEAPAVAPADTVVINTAADVVLAEDESSKEVKPLTGLRKRMSQPLKRNNEVVHGAVTITEHGDASKIVNANLQKTTGSMNGYRIVIFMDNSATARGGAASARGRFMSIRANIPTYLTYDNPYFKVSVGNFLTKEEAMEVLGSIKQSFPDAFIAQATINVMEFAK